MRARSPRRPLPLAPLSRLRSSSAPGTFAISFTPKLKLPSRPVPRWLSSRNLRMFVCLDNNCEARLVLESTNTAVCFTEHRRASPFPRIAAHAPTPCLFRSLFLLFSFSPPSLFLSHIYLLARSPFRFLAPFSHPVGAGDSPRRISRMYYVRFMAVAAGKWVNATRRAHRTERRNFYSRAAAAAAREAKPTYVSLSLSFFLSSKSLTSRAN